jgi:spore coat polysaccharide biosynthesis protein SpsF (cytidylyltransferase family)
MRGDLYNVLRRSIQAAELLNAQYVVRVGGDTPLVDISQMGLFLERLINEGLDYVSFNKDTCASAFYFEVITIDALRKTAALTNAKEDLEHVTKFIIDNPDSFRLKTVDMDLNPQFIRKVRLTVDYPEDLRLVNDVVKQLPDKLRFSSYDVLKIMQQNGRYDYSGCTKG